MKNRIVMTTLVTLLFVITLALFASTQQIAGSQAQQKSQPQTGGKAVPTGVEPMSMDEMLRKCRQHCESSTTMLESVIRQAEDAKKSGELPKMQSALDNAEQQAQEMKKHMEMCLSMITMMQGVHGQTNIQQDQKQPANTPKKK